MKLEPMNLDGARRHGVIGIAHDMCPARTKYLRLATLTRCSPEDIKNRAAEFADALENNDPKPGGQDAPLQPTMAVKLAAWRRDAAEKELAEALRAAREHSLYCREVGEAIGTSDEAARQRFRDRA